MEAKKQHIHIEKIRLLYLHSLTPAILSSIAAFFLVAALWSSAIHHHLLIWLSATIFLAVLRVSLILKFKRTNPQGIEVLAWEAPYAISLLVVFFTWSVGLLLITPFDHLPAVFIVNAFIIGLAGSAISWYSAIRYLQLGTISLALIPMTVALLRLPYAETLWVGIAMCCLYLSCLTTSLLLHKTLSGNLALAYDLEESKKNAAIIANTDALTGLNNRRAFFNIATTSLLACRQSDAPVSLMILDLDLFKTINDQFGHENGDRVLCHIAELLRSKLRASDICCRFGGEAFAILLPQTNQDEARATAEKLRALIAATPISLAQKEPIVLHASFGVTAHGANLDEMLHSAEKAMYQAKAQGGDLVAVDDPSKRDTANQALESNRRKGSKIRVPSEH